MTDWTMVQKLQVCTSPGLQLIGHNVHTRPCWNDLIIFSAADSYTILPSPFIILTSASNPVSIHVTWIKEFLHLVPKLNRQYAPVMFLVITDQLLVITDQHR